MRRHNFTGQRATHGVKKVPSALRRYRSSAFPAAWSRARRWPASTAMHQDRSQSEACAGRCGKQSAVGLRRSARPERRLTSSFAKRTWLSRANMAKLNILRSHGKEVGTYDIEPTDFAVRINKQLLHDAVVMYQSNLRQGTHETRVARHGGRLDQEDVSPKRHGQRPRRFAAQRYSSWRRSHPRIHNRDYSYRLPRKAVQLATRMALASKLRDEELIVIDDLAITEPRDQGYGRDSQASRPQARRFAAGGHRRSMI